MGFLKTLALRGAEKEKTFDTVIVFREIKEKIVRETGNMSFAEFKNTWTKESYGQQNRLCLRILAIKQRL